MGFELLLPILIPIIAPMVVAGVKKYGPSIPKFLLPLLSMGVGVAVGYFTDLGAQAGGVLGAAGVFVRETYDQVKKALTSDDVPTT